MEEEGNPDISLCLLRVTVLGKEAVSNVNTIWF